MYFPFSSGWYEDCVRDRWPEAHFGEGSRLRGRFPTEEDGERCGGLEQGTRE